MRKYILLDSENIDGAYQRICSELGLYGKAFLWHKKSVRESKQLDYIYKSLHDQYVKRLQIG